MLVNLRPEESPLLDRIVEAVDERFNAQQQEEILEIVREVLGRNEDVGEDGDEGIEVDARITETGEEDVEMEGG